MFLRFISIQIAILLLLAVAMKKCTLTIFLSGLFALAFSQESAVQTKGYYSSNFIIDNIPRTINFYIPAGFGKKDEYPLVFVLHGEGETGTTMIKRYSSDIERLADSVSAIVIYPDAVKGHWNTRLGSHAALDTINDAGFTQIMLDYFVQRYNADGRSVYIIGFNNGGDMAWRLGCSLTKKIAAIAPFTATAANVLGSCAQNVPFFNAQKYTGQPVKKYSYSALSEAWRFLLKNQLNK